MCENQLYEHGIGSLCKSATTFNEALGPHALRATALCAVRARFACFVNFKYWDKLCAGAGEAVLSVHRWS